MKKLMVSIGLSIGLSFTSVVRASDSYEAPRLGPLDEEFAVKVRYYHSKPDTGYADFIEKLLTGQSPFLDADGTPRGPLDRDDDPGSYRRDDACRRVKTRKRKRKKPYASKLPAPVSS